MDNGGRSRRIVIAIKVFFILLWFFFMWDGLRWILD